MISQKELRRRKTCQLVLIQAWRYRKRSPSVVDLSTAVTLGWALVRSYTFMHHTKTRGVTFEGRQQLLDSIRRLPDERISVYLKPEPSNPYDENAIRVEVAIDGVQRLHAGYIARQLAEDISPQLVDGKRCIAFYDGVTGAGKGNLGLNFSYVMLDKRKAASKAANNIR